MTDSGLYAVTAAAACEHMGLLTKKAILRVRSDAARIQKTSLFKTSSRQYRHDEPPIPFFTDCLRCIEDVAHDLECHLSNDDRFSR